MSNCSFNTHENYYKLIPVCGVCMHAQFVMPVNELSNLAIRMNTCGVCATVRAQSMMLVNELSNLAMRYNCMIN